MPELPEVEAVRRALEPLVRGRRIVRVRVRHPISVRPQRQRTLEMADGQRVQGVGRRGKHLLLQVGPERPGVLAMHFMLDGHLVWYDGRMKPEAFVDVAIHMEHGTLGFTDPRKFGRVRWYAGGELPRGISKLGAEPLEREFSFRRFEEILRKSRLQLKTLLMNQQKIAGIGNIYASESLWAAQLSTWRRPASLKAGEARRLYKSIGRVLRRALECCSDPAPDFRDAEWWFQGLEEILGVYGRRGLPCRRRGCKGTIRRREQAGRATYYCPRCQR